MLYLFAQSSDVSLKGSVHSVEGFCFAEIFTHIIRQLFLLLVDLSHQLLSIIKVPERKESLSILIFVIIIAICYPI